MSTVQLSLFNSMVLNVSAMSQDEIFIYLLSGKEPTIIKALGKFIYNAFKKRYRLKGTHMQHSGQMGQNIQN